MPYRDFFERLGRRLLTGILSATIALGAVSVGAGVNFRADVHDAETGALLSSQTIHNLVTTAGLNLIKTAVSTGSMVHAWNFAFGTSSTAALAGNTILGAEVFRDVITNGPNGTADATLPILTMQYYLSSASANGSTITEVGLFNAAGANNPTLYARVILASSIIKNIAIAVAFTWTLTWAAV